MSQEQTVSQVSACTPDISVWFARAAGTVRVKVEAGRVPTLQLAQAILRQAIAQLDAQIACAQIDQMAHQQQRGIQSLLRPPH
jgi:hypothetical protein